MRAGIKEESSRWVACIFLKGSFLLRLLLTVLLICLLYLVTNRTFFFSFAVYVVRSVNIRAKGKAILSLPKWLGVLHVFPPLEVPLL